MSRGWTTDDDAAAAAYAGDHYDDRPADHWPQHDLDRLSDARAAADEEQRDRFNDDAADHDARQARARRDAARVPGTDPAEGRW